MVPETLDLKALRSRISEIHLPTDGYVIMAAMDYLRARGMRTTERNVRTAIRNVYLGSVIHGHVIDLLEEPVKKD
jgi:hypothetical protein